MPDATVSCFQSPNLFPFHHCNTASYKTLYRSQDLSEFIITHWDQLPQSDFNHYSTSQYFLHWTNSPKTQIDFYTTLCYTRACLKTARRTNHTLRKECTTMNPQPNYPFDLTGYTCFSIINCPVEQVVTLLKEYANICIPEDRVPFIIWTLAPGSHPTPNMSANFSPTKSTYRSFRKKTSFPKLTNMAQ